ncbi:MAG: branched-chain amino acid ABC transporter permease [Rhizobiaceae bacterium]|nr:branched-chain amino acid ABC transporter permease [Rhizobiaceae bacterium]
MVDFLNALVMFANFVFLPGLAYGAQLALGALGITLVFGILRFSNFAHGDLMAFGTMITILVTWWLIGMGVTLGPLPTALLALPIGIIGAVIMALIIDRTVFRFYRQQRSASIVLVMASVGVMFILNGIVRLVIGPNEQRFADGERFLITVREFRDWTGLAEGLAIRLPVAITVIVAVVVVVALFWFLTYSRTGKAMRAYSDNEDLALLSGIDPDKVVRVTWVIAAALATIAGVLYGLDKSFRPFTYFQLLLPMFAAAIVGGIGQPIGAIAGGFVVAFSEVTLTYAYKRVLEYLGFAPDGLVQLLSTEYKFAISFVILVIVLLIRPTGIFRGRVL